LLYTVLKIAPGLYLSAPFITEDDAQWWQSDKNVVSGVAALISQTLGNNVPHHKEHLISWLTGSSGAGLGDGISIRRAVLAVVSRDKSDIQTVLEKSLQQFGDQLYIKHTPTLQQDGTVPFDHSCIPLLTNKVHTQVLLLAAGYVHRKAPLHLSMMMRSGAHLNAVSNRLAATSPRARFLGMVVGEALSSLVDKGDKRMDFKVDEMNTAEARWFKGLVSISDTVGSIDGLKSGRAGNIPKELRSRAPKPAKRSMAPPTGSKIISIEEIETDKEESDDDGLTPYAKPDLDEEESDDDGLTPYAKPDLDEEDSEDDPTLITRNKPTAPVYIRDLISYLRDTENYDRQKLGLETAAPLIRRKANFGTEVTDHAEELATLLVGTQDKYEIENFQDIRLQGMIAILIASPLKMGQWFSKTFFDGDYSVSQRASVLTTLGLGARELGGFGAEDSKLTSTKSLPSTSFPSHTLPSSLHNLYSGRKPQETAVDTLSTQLQNTMIAPLAADLADKLTGPAILKVRTFSSRMAVEKKRKKPIANAFAKVVADGFFFPLTGRFFMHLRAYGTSHHNVVFQPYLLSHFLKTLSLLLHASGPSTLSLPQLTSEFWDLLLNLRAQSIGSITTIESILFGFLTILEINEDKRKLVEAHGRQLLETQEWVEGVFGRMGGGEEDERVRMLAAGVLVRVRECVEKYQALLMGDLASFRE
jgi:telomere length regulation protein